MIVGMGSTWGLRPQPPTPSAGPDFYESPRFTSRMPVLIINPLPQKRCDAPPTRAHTNQKSLKLKDAFPPSVNLR